MKIDLVLSGVVGLIMAGFVFLAASGIAGFLPWLIHDALVMGLVFALLLLVTVVEMPMMILAMRQMVHSASTPRAVVLGTNVGYVAFASVYAAVFLLITGENRWALILAALSVLRFASGVLVR